MAKKLIEVALPLEKINAESAREKSIRHGHPSTLHLWWARRPLAAARAVIWSSLVDDPSAHPEEFPTEEEQEKERKRLFDILEQLVVWENSNNPDVLETTKKEIMKSTGGNPPELLDPFAGGGAIPLEAQRLGLVAHAHDLNPVAVMINKAMIEIPPRFAGRPPVNPDAKEHFASTGYVGAAGLAEDVRWYGEWMKQQAFQRIGHLYPQVDVPDELGGGKATVIAWIWARTVKCPNPACGCEMPLASSFVLSKKKGNEAWVHPVLNHDENTISYEVKYGKMTEDLCPKLSRGAKFKCIMCGESTEEDYIKSESCAGRMGAVLLGIVAEGKKGRIYISPNSSHISAAIVSKPEDFPDQNLPYDPRNIWCVNYGLDTYDKLFTNRQLTALTTFSSLVAEAQQKAEQDALLAGLPADGIPLRDGGTGAKAYGEAVGVYLAFVIDKMTDYHSSICSWHSSGEKMRNTFGRQAIPMVWDYAECNPFCTSSGSYDNMIEWVYKTATQFPASGTAEVSQFDAQSDCGLRNIMVSSDPPYYDNIGYADLSDYFYVWLRQSLKSTFPKLFRTMLVPKAEELIATPYRHDGNTEKAKVFFEDGMLNTCKQIYEYAREDVPVTIYYAYKQSDTENDQTASTGWETMLASIIKAGFAITGTWPMRTEMAVRQIASGTNALASSIVLVCRKRPKDAQGCTRRNFLAELRRELRPALQKLQSSNIAPVDLAQSAIGPGMGVFSKYSAVLEADGTPMTVREALQIINQELDVFFNEQDGALDKESRFCLDLYMQFGFNNMKFGDADTLARAKNTSVDVLKKAEVLVAEKGIVHLIPREELPEAVSPSERIIWKLTQQLTQAFETGGFSKCANILAGMHGSNVEDAKALAYRLYTLAERKGWTNEAYAYNNLIVAWTDIMDMVSRMRESGETQYSFGY